MDSSILYTNRRLQWEMNQDSNKRNDFIQSWEKYSDRDIKGKKKKTYRK